MSPLQPLDEKSFLVLGLGVTGSAVARALVARGLSVVLAEDADAPVGEALATELGAVLHRRPSGETLHALVTAVDAVVPAPGVPDDHHALAAAADAGRPVLSELDLAAAWDERPVIAITGTNGKTTVTTLVSLMLDASGRPSPAVGNTEVPLVEAIEDPVPVSFVVEASSFRLGRTRSFRPRVATWLNFAADHLDVHSDLEAYRAAKARIFDEQGPGDTAVVNAEDPVVADAEPRRPGGPTVIRFGLAPEVEGRPTDAFERDGVLHAPGGVELVHRDELHRALPHDRTNALAAAATALAGGADADVVRGVLRSFRGLPHRVELIGQRDGVRWYDDSKATAPHATLAALEGFERVVLVAGGRNKGLDLGALGAASDRVRAVVGIGEAGPDVVAAFPDRPGRSVDDMRTAVLTAAELASPGDVVLLSPGCASFDWYGSYAERGDDFARNVRELVLGVPA